MRPWIYGGLCCFLNVAVLCLVQLLLFSNKLWLFFKASSVTNVNKTMPFSRIALVYLKCKYLGSQLYAQAESNRKMEYVYNKVSFYV